MQLVNLSGNSVLANVCGKSIKCLVDTGATVSCCSVNLLESLGIFRKDLQKPEIHDAVGVGGEVHQIIGKVFLPIIIGSVAVNQKFHVFEKLHQRIILGIDFMRENKVKLDLEDNTLFITDPDSISIHSVEMNSGLARTVQSLTIPPFSQVDVPIQVSNLTCEVAILEPLSSLPQQSLAGAKCCISLLHGNKSSMRIMNPSQKGVFLPANSVLASVSPVETDSVVSLDKNDSLKTTNQNAPSHTSDDTEKDTETLSFDLADSDLTNEQKELLIHFLNKNRKVFAKDLSELGHTHLYEHVIDTGDARPIRKRFYRQTPKVSDEMERQISQLLKYDVIEESNSEWQAPVVMCRKKSGELRFCIDYRELNKVTKPKFFPLPRLEDVLMPLVGLRPRYFLLWTSCRVTGSVALTLTQPTSLPLLHQVESISGKDYLLG